jgi:Na+/glutamate symporter
MKLTPLKKAGIGALVGAVFGIPIAYSIAKNMNTKVIERSQKPEDITDEKTCEELRMYWYNRSCHSKPY